MKSEVVFLEQDGVRTMWQKRSSCEGCQGRQSCGFRGHQAGQVWSLPVRCLKGDLADLQNQESYLLGMPSGVLSGFASVLYGLPVIILMLGALIGKWLWPGSDRATQIIVAAALVGLFCFYGGLFVIRARYLALLLNRRLSVSRLQG